MDVASILPLRLQLRPTTDRAVAFYWLAWSVVVGFDVATWLQSGYQFWQLSPYAWWMAPFVLWWTCPVRSSQRVGIAWPLLVLTWAVFRAHDFLFAATGTWNVVPDDSGLAMLERSLEAFLIGLVSAVAFARPLVWISGALATRAAIVAGISVAYGDYYYNLLDLSRWEQEPLLNALRVLSAAMMILLLAFAAGRLRRSAEASAGVGESAVNATGRPRLGGFGSSVTVAIFTILVAWHAWETIDNVWVAVSVAVIGWTLAITLVTHSSVRAWRRLGTSEWITEPLRKVVAAFGRGGVLVTVVPIWACAIWMAAPSAGSEMIDLSRSLAGPQWTIAYEPDRKTIVIEGRLEPGVAAAVRTALRAQPSVEYVELNSPGGRAWEGESLAEAIQSRGLVTVVREKCSSACTSALAAGRERWLVSGALVGLHASSARGLPTDADATARKSSFFRDLGVAEALVRQGATVPFWDVWYPTEKELLVSGMVTRVVTEDGLAEAIAHAPPRPESNGTLLQADSATTAPDGWDDL